MSRCDSQTPRLSASFYQGGTGTRGRYRRPEQPTRPGEELARWRLDRLVAHATASSVRSWGGEHLTAGSLDQARICFRFARQMLGEDGYRYQDSAQRIGILHTASGTRLRVMSSDPKKAMGIVGARLVVADEPGSWTLLGGQAMYDAIQTAQGKNQMTVCYLGTIAPDPIGIGGRTW